MTKVIFSLELYHSCVIRGKIILHPSIPTMSVIILLLLLSISVAAVFLAAFIWSVKSGQYDDEESPPMRILFDDTTTNNQSI